MFYIDKLVSVFRNASGLLVDTSPTDRLPVTEGCIPSDGSNTSTAALLGGATFTGTGEQVRQPDVGISCKADANGTLYFDFSNDGTNWDTFPTSGFKVFSGIHEFHRAVKLGRYFRVRLVNGSAAQTYLRLYTYYGSFRQPSAPLNQPFGLDADAILVRPTFPWLDISRGLASGIESIKKFGRATVDTTFSPLCFSGTTGGIYNTPQSGSATTLRIKAGGNANDTAAGSGAREVTLQGLDQNFEFATEAIATAGASASSATTTTFTRLFRAYVSASGTYATVTAGSHAGDITIENGAGGTDWGTIDSTDFPKGQSEIGAYTVPAGKTGYVKLRNMSVNSGKTVDLVFFQRPSADDTSAPYAGMRAQSVVSSVTGGAIETFGSVEIPFGPYVGPTDIGFMGKVDVGTGSISVEFEIFLLDE